MAQPYGPSLLLPCSGAADVGEISDRAARAVTKQGTARMFCLAGLGGGVEPLVKVASEADVIVAIDGCPMDCAKKTIEKAGLAVTHHLRVTDMGYEKGQAPATQERVDVVAAQTSTMLS